MQMPSSPPALQPRPTLFGWREPEALARAAREDLAACRRALRHGSKTFLAASALLPRRVHEPACALYAFCRLADDAVDEGDDGSGSGGSDGDSGGGGGGGGGGGANSANRAGRNNSTNSTHSPDSASSSCGDDGEGEVRDGAGGDAACDPVERLRERVRRAYRGEPLDAPADRALAVVVVRHAIPPALFDALLEGFAWDRRGRRYDSLEQLHDYAARVAGSIGAMMALLMGERSAAGLARACDLGVAMQLSNIARDVGEDARRGRLYLPRQWLVEAGIDPDAWLAAPAFTPALAGVVRRLLDAADALYARAGAGVAGLPLDCRAGINAARFGYAAIGDAVRRRGLDSVGGRARVGAARKAALLSKSLLWLRPDGGSATWPALPANRFLVDAAATAAPWPPRRGVGERVVWALELLSRRQAVRP